MNLRHTIYTTFVAFVALLTSSCGQRNEWTVEGRIEGADGCMMIVEGCDNGRWYPIDSVALDSTGKFRVSHPAQGYPDIFRLRLGDKMLYFPIDSIETVTVLTHADAFDSDYTLAGSTAAEMLMNVDRRVREAAAGRGISAISSDTLLKRELGGILLGDPSGIVSYYIINKQVGNVPLFNPSNSGDLKIIGAVATAFDQKRPNDPRTTYLRNLYLSNRHVSETAPRDTLYAEQIGLLDIRLYDNKGVKRSLSQLAEQGKVVLLNFTAYTAEESPAFNRELNKLYDRYRDRGLEIYQVAVDDDEYQWREAARPLPWITVFCSRTDGTKAVRDYNVEALPTSFIINRQGDIVERISGTEGLAEAVARQF